MARKKSKKICIVCDALYESTGGAGKYCPVCKEKALYKICLMCGESYKAPYKSHAKYCPVCREKVKGGPRNCKKQVMEEIKSQAPSMSINEMIKFARENGVSYGKAVLIYGK